MNKQTKEDHNHHGPGRAETSPALLMHADALQARLDAAAREQGYVDYRDLYKRTVDEREPLSVEHKRRLLHGIRPIAQQMADPLGLTPDITGLPAIQDIATSVARLIRVLLLGYTHDEAKQLGERVTQMRRSADREIEAQANHDTALEQLRAMSAAEWRRRWLQP